MSEQSERNKQRGRELKARRRGLTQARRRGRQMTSYSDAVLAELEKRIVKRGIDLPRLVVDRGVAIAHLEEQGMTVEQAAQHLIVRLGLIVKQHSPGVGTSSIPD